MKKNYIAEVITGFLKGKFPESTEKKVQHWLIEEKNTKEKRAALVRYWDSLPISSANNKIYSSLNSTKKKLGMKPSGYISFRPFLRIAAILLPILILSTGLFYLYRQHTHPLLSINVPYGERRQLTLPDSTIVWLNAGSKLSYSERSGNSSRRVTLEGEAFFDVRSDLQRPFVVETGELAIHVTGTRFTVYAYPFSENISTILSQGKITVETQRKEIFHLAPSQQLLYNPFTAIATVKNTEAPEIPAWIYGKLIFEHLSLKEIIHILERAYDIAFEVDINLLQTENYVSAKFVNQETIEEILDVLKELYGFEYSVYEEKIALAANIDN